jgi:hypothetical protein
MPKKTQRTETGTSTAVNSPDEGIALTIHGLASRRKRIPHGTWRATPIKGASL